MGVLFLLLFFGFYWIEHLGWAQETSISEIEIEQKPKDISSAYSQLFSLQIQPFRPESLIVDNGTYTFDYRGSETEPLNSFLLELGWAPKILEWYGAFYLEGQMGISTFQGATAVASDLPLFSNTSYSLFLFGLDTRLMYAATWFPWKHWIPFLEGGYLYSIFYQPGSSGLESVQGGIGNLVAALGVRFWLNQEGSIQDGEPPFFLTIKLNHIFSHPGNVNLESTALSGGLSIGL